MRYIVLLQANPTVQPPPPALMEAIMTLGGEASAAGALLDTAGLAPSATGARVQLAGGQVSVTDGPFTEAKEFVSYAVYQVRTKEEAVEWTRRFMTLHQQHWPDWEGHADILQVFGPDDFPAEA